MHRAEALFMLQKQKRDLFASLEAKTHLLLGCPEEELPLLMEERQQLIEQIDLISGQIVEEAQQDPAFLEAASNQHSREALSQPLQEVYDMGLEIRAAAGRIKELSIQVSIRMECCRERILEKIKNVNSSAMARASKYYQPAARPPSFQSKG